LSIPDNSTNSFLSGFLNEDEDELEMRSRPKRTALDADLYADGDYNNANEQGFESDVAKEAEASGSDFTTVQRLIDANIKALNERYPGGGLRASRVITGNILREAPHDFFDRYEEDIQLGTEFVQFELTERGGSDIVALSQENPTDEAIQEKAYFLLKVLILEYISNRTNKNKDWHGRDRAVLSQLISNEIIGFSTIDPLWRDKSINEIAVNGPKNVTIEAGGHWTYVPSCKFRDQKHMEQLLERLFQAVGKSLSRTEPMLKSRLHDNSRLWGIHRSIMPSGPSLNVRRHPERHWTPMDLVDRGSGSPEMLTEVGNLIHKGCSFLVVGGTSTGKTSMLNALSGFYRNDVRILTVEDSLELKLNPNKMVAPGMETLKGRPGTEQAGVTIRDLVRATLQMAPNVIIVGESTGGEAFDLCQALNTGHAGASTLHANTVRDAIPRLLSMVGQGEVIQAEAALPLIGAAIDFIIFLEHNLDDGSRKIAEIAEIPSYPEFDEGRKPFLNPRTIWKIDRENATWNKVDDISSELVERRGLAFQRDLNWEELKELSKV